MLDLNKRTHAILALLEIYACFHQESFANVIFLTQGET